MGDPVSIFDRFLAAEQLARAGLAPKETADALFRRWLTFPPGVRQRVEEHFKPGCTRAGWPPQLPEAADPTLRDLVAAAFAHPYNTVEHQRHWLVALDYEQERCPDPTKDYPLLRLVCERLIHRLG